MTPTPIRRTVYDKFRTYACGDFKAARRRRLGGSAWRVVPAKQAVRKPLRNLRLFAPRTPKESGTFAEQSNFRTAWKAGSRASAQSLVSRTRRIAGLTVREECRVRGYAGCGVGAVRLAGPPRTALAINRGQGPQSDASLWGPNRGLTVNRVAAPDQACKTWLRTSPAGAAQMSPAASGRGR